MKELMRLRKNARKGDKRAINALIRRSEKMAIRANKMLNRLASHGYTKQAYMSAQTFIQSAYGDNADRYKTNLKDIDAIYQQALSIEHFLSLKTSTLSGTKEVENARVAGFRLRFPKMSAGMSKRDILDFFDFLAEESVDAYLSESSMYSSGDEVDSFLYAVNHEDLEYDAIVEAIERYQETFANPSPDESENFYYDDLQKYLKGEITVKFDGRKVIINKKKK